ncbi:MAG TPA: 1-acyl-sn-glycerol-3-phosphate acyltransferase [Myxococcota bacterium]|nr:1-acyl-sn-glycerol-3-phosphate acyltransferase [Myxococcota bacterium]
MAETPAHPRDAQRARFAPPPPDAAAAGARAAVAADPLSAMTERFNVFFRFFARRFFAHFDLDDETVARLRELESQGSVVYVMRYASRLDYFLFNVLFLREGLRLASFANGIRFWYYRPFFEALRILWRRPRGVPQDIELVRTREYARELTLQGASFFLFLRTASLRAQLRGRKSAVAHAKLERDLLAEVVRAAERAPRPVHLVPLALFWRKGPRSPRRFLNLSYGAPTRPSDVAKVASFLTTYRGLHVKVLDPIDVRAEAESRETPVPSLLAPWLRRRVLSALYREERVVEGPVLQPLHRVQQIVLRQASVRNTIREIAAARSAPPEQVRAEAEAMFGEIAANMNSTFLALLDWAVGVVTRRLFVQIEQSGIEKVAEYARRHPVVLVPSHRSYFDFIILSMMFYGQHLIPPHIAARENMGFGPFGFLWRRAGAFFLRTSFDDPLYKAVFRAYLAHLIREGFTQEFFIEGGRSRTGRTLAPRLGMLAWNLEAFLQSGRRDLFFVPIAISYERLVEEGAMVGELEGAEKTQESMLGLMRARKFLSRRFGSVFVNFGEPISLGEALGPRAEAWREQDPAETDHDRRAFVEQVGTRIVERINWAMAATATSVACCALLGERHRGLFRPELVRRMQQIVDLLRLMDVRLTPELSRDVGDFSVSIASLLRMDLIASSDDPRGEILYFEPAKRRALDLYRNSVLHFLAAPSFLARSLLRGATTEALQADLSLWLGLFGRELFVNRGEVLAAHVPGFIDHFARSGWIAREGESWRATHAGIPELRFLAELTRPLLESYFVALSAALAVDGPVGSKELVRSAREHFERAALLGEVGLDEASNPVAFGTAIDWLEQRGILARAPAVENAKGRRETRYTRGSAFGELAPLRDRLAAELAPR